MEKIYVTGGRPLKGAVELSGSKNGALPILAGTLLASSGEFVISNVPHVSDIYAMLDMLKELGAKVEFTPSGVVHINAQALRTHVAPYELVRKMRASFYVAGPLLARLGIADVPLPGGCVIGKRPVDYHIDAFRAMGAKVDVEHGYVLARAARLRGAAIYLDPRYCSVGATVNIMLAASLAAGVTTIENVARDPEIVDFAHFLNKMGVEITGAGTATMTVTGVRSLHACEHSIIPDRLEAGTYLLGAVVTNGDVTAHPIDPNHLGLFLQKLEEGGLVVERKSHAVRVRVPHRPQAVDITTAPFPGFPTDLHPPFMAMLCVAEGRGLVHETIYDGRFRYVDELRRMGAHIDVNDDTAAVTGVERLTGAPVESPDTRAGAALVLAGLAAEGETEIGGVQFIDRGYERLEEKLNGLGARIVRCDEAVPQRKLRAV